MASKEAKVSDTTLKAPALPVVPQQPPKLSPVAWVTRFGSALSRGLSGVLEDALVPGEWLKQQDTTFASVKAFTNNLIYSNCRRDQAIYLELFNEAQKLVQQGGLTSKEVDSLLEKSGKVIASSGTSAGLCARLSRGYERKCDVVPISISEMVDVYRLFQLGDVRDISKEGIDLVDTYIEINADADSGLPYPSAKTREKMVFHTKFMNHLWSKAREGVLDKTLAQADNLWMSTCLLKNKMELYDLDERLTKTRPYYVFPNGLKWLMMTAAKPLQDSLLDLTNPLTKGSYSAYHFSWVPRENSQGGGAAELVKHILDSEDGLLHGCAYGDDQLWWYKSGGKLYVWVPDNEMMDMSVDTALGDPISAVLGAMCGIPSARKYLKLEVIPDKLGKTWSSIFLLGVSLALKHRTLLEGSIPAVLTRLASGVPLTTVIDMVASGFGFVRVKRHFETLVRKKGDPVAAMQASWSQMETVGLRVKDATKKCYSRIAGDTGIDAADLPRFLGMVIRTDGTTFWPEPDRTRIWQTLVNPRTIVANRTGVLLGRYYNITLCGGYCFPEVYEACRVRWLSEVSHTKPVVTEAGVGFEDLVQKLPAIDGAGNVVPFPEPQSIRALYTSSVKPGGAVPSVSGVPKTQERLLTGAKPSWADMVEDDEAKEAEARAEGAAKGKEKARDEPHAPARGFSFQTPSRMVVPSPVKPRASTADRPGQLGETSKGKQRRLDLDAAIREQRDMREARAAMKRKAAGAFKVRKTPKRESKQEVALAKFETPSSEESSDL